MSSLLPKGSAKFSFGRAFPVPRYLSMAPAGIEISDQSIRMIRMEKGERGLQLRAFAERTLPPGVVAGGDIVKPQELQAALGALAKEFGLRFVNASLPDDKAYVFQTQIPENFEGSIRQAIEFKLEENVPINPADAVFDFRVAPAGPREVSVTVLPRETISAYLDAYRGAGLVPLSFETSSAAVARAVVPANDLRSFVVVHIGYHKTHVAIVSGGIAYFSSVVPIGGAALTDAIERSFRIGTEEARKIKHEKSFIRSKENIDFFSSILTIVSALKDEVHKVIAYWESRAAGISAGREGGADASIESIFLSGRNAGIPGLDEYFAANIRKPVTVANVWQNVFSFDDSIPELPFEESLGYAVSIGLSLLN